MAPLPVVFLHGTRLTRTAWWPQLERLGPTRRCVAVDLPGHGLRAGEPFTIDAAVAATVRAIDEAAGGRAIVVGLSLGGYVAMVLAARHPERAAGLVLAGATHEPVGPWAIPFGWLAAVFAAVPRSIFDGLNRAFFRLRYPADVARRIDAGGYWPRGGAQALRQLLGRRFRPGLARYPGPILVVNGEWDAVMRLGERGFLAAVPQARRRRLRGALHLSNLDAPDALSAAVAAFAGSEAPAAPSMATDSPAAAAGPAGGRMVD